MNNIVLICLRKDFLKGVQLEEMLNHLNYFELSNNQWFKGQECPDKDFLSEDSRV